MKESQETTKNPTKSQKPSENQPKSQDETPPKTVGDPKVIVLGLKGTFFLIFSGIIVCTIIYAIIAALIFRYPYNFLFLVPNIGMASVLLCLLVVMLGLITSLLVVKLVKFLKQLHDISSIKIWGKTILYELAILGFILIFAIFISFLAGGGEWQICSDVCTSANTNLLDILSNHFYAVIYSGYPLVFLFTPFIILLTHLTKNHYREG